MSVMSNTTSDISSTLHNWRHVCEMNEKITSPCMISPLLSLELLTSVYTLTFMQAAMPIYFLYKLMLQYAIQLRYDKLVNLKSYAHALDYMQRIIIITIYRNSRIFRVTNISCDKFSC